MIYVVMKHWDGGQVVVCAFYEEEKAKKRVSELMDSRTEKCWYDYVGVE